MIIISQLFLSLAKHQEKFHIKFMGNKYNTTPYLMELSQLKSDKMITFSDMVSVAPFTRVAVPSLLSVSLSKDYTSKIGSTPSIYKILKETAIDTTFISAELTKGFHDVLATSIIADNKNIINISERYDEALVEKFNQSLLQKDQQLITFHLRGSHNKYKSRYPKSRQCFTPNIPEANYLNSIRYTDYVLSKIMNIVNKSSKQIILIYLPDHGEYVNDNGDGIYGHGFKDLTYNEISIPLIFLFNDKFISEHKKIISTLKRHKNKAISQDNISHTILGLMGVQSPTFYNITYDLSSEKLKEHKRFIIDRNLNIESIESIDFIKANYPDIDITNVCD